MTFDASDDQSGARTAQLAGDALAAALSDYLLIAEAYAQARSGAGVGPEERAGGDELDQVRLLATQSAGVLALALRLERIGRRAGATRSEADAHHGPDDVDRCADERALMCELLESLALVGACESWEDLGGAPLLDPGEALERARDPRVVAFMDGPDGPGAGGALR